MTKITRDEAEAIIRKQLDNEINYDVPTLRHYGKVDLKYLLDAIYGDTGRGYVKDYDRRKR